MQFFPISIFQGGHLKRVYLGMRLEKSRAGQMVLDICGRYDTACFYFF